MRGTSVVGRAVVSRSKPLLSFASKAPKTAESARPAMIAMPESVMPSSQMPFSSSASHWAAPPFGATVLEWQQMQAEERTCARAHSTSCM